MKIITAGSYYLDIDAYAGIVAYAELLQKQGIEAKAVSTAPPNESVTQTVRSWGADIQTSYTPSSDDTFTLIDVSTPGHFDTFVDDARIEAIIDHHTGHETYWKERIGDNVDIDFVGAACTLVYEYWKKAGLFDQISTMSARLLATGILDNTLNFSAKITTTRDHEAYEDLMTRADLPDNWPEIYFGECQAAIDADPIGATLSDTKTLAFVSNGQSLQVGQCAVWNATDLLTNQLPALEDAFEKNGNSWFINIISISEGRSYFICRNPEIQLWLANLLDIEFHDDRAAADRMWLRKEIIKHDRDALEG